MASQGSADGKKSFNERYKSYDESIRDNGLGRVMRGLDTQSGQPVALLKVYQWIEDLDAHILQNLHNAVEAARQLDQPTLVRVLDHNFASRTANEQFVIVLNAFDGVALKNLPSASRMTIDQALKFGITLARALEYAVQRQSNQAIFKWLRPSLAPDKIYLPKAQNQDEPMLVELGWTALLSNNGRAVATDPPAPGYVRQLGWLLLCRLGNNLSVYSDGLPPQNELKNALQAWQKQNQSDTSEKLSLLLDNALATPPTISTPGLLAERLQAIANQVASTQRQPAPGPRPQAPTGPPPLTQTPMAQPTIKPAGASAAPPLGRVNTPAAAPHAVNDRLLIYEGSTKGRLIEDRSLAVLKAKGADVPTLLTLGGAKDDEIELAGLLPRRLSLLYQNSGVDGRYTITDTGNGVDHPSHYARLDDVPLSPVFGALLLHDTELQINNYCLQLKRGLVTATGQAAKFQKALQLGQKHFAAEPGTTLTLPVTITNPTNEVDRFWLVLDGQPRVWGVEHPDAIPLLKDESAAARLTITLPPRQQSTASTHDVTLRLISMHLQAQVAAVRLKIEILPVIDYTGGLDPAEQLRIGRAARVWIANQGNLTRSFKLNWRDRSNQLLFEPNETTLTVRAGEEEEVIFRPYVRTWRWLGGEKTHNFSVMVAPQAGMAQTYPGQVISHALIPRWAVVLFGLLLVACLLFITLLLKPDFAEQDFEVFVTAKPGTPAATVVGNATPVAGVPFSLHWTPLHGCFFSVYQDGKVRSALAWQNDEGRYPATPAPAKAGSKFEVRLTNCLLLAEKTWTVEVAPAPTGLPTPVAAPIITQFMMSIENVDRLNAEDLPTEVAFTPTPTSTPDVKVPSTEPHTILVGQSGDLCFQWTVTGAFTELQLNPPLIDLKGAKPQGKACKPIAQLLTKPEELAFTLQARNGDQQSVPSAELQVSVLTPVCYLNTDPERINLWEGPGRTFAQRGQLQQSGRVFVTTRPLYLSDQVPPELWQQVTLPGDPRPAWVVYGYLACNGDVLALPVTAAIPATPTPPATATPTPTLTPTPVLQPLVSVEPEVIAVGGCALLKWNIQQVKEVHLNGEGVVGVAQKEDCPTTTGHLLYTWTITNLDGSTTELQRTLIVNPASAAPVAPTPP